MLDSETKDRINRCRQILVGKVPDPKSQVEQITIALIYKFMDDMDAQAEALGGKRSFFVNGFERFGWPKLLAPQMGGQDTLNLYAEAIGQMTQNTHLPTLFRDIFKNAYLPYRDPETLRSFLKEIDVFRYDHSEKLGDAFEYLLSVLGSQGNAGQFRTPRHLIDFIVSVVNPQKHERLLDPACGTAGFLISAWKHILGQNAKARPGDQLTAKERNKLVENIVGYDISPDMVRLSLVNLYLHGFPSPRVDEYDTLTSDERWNEHFDVILANPPFMSPKGGIKPHKRFSIQAKRSEVLFVDYIAEHLTPTGRAGIIVPEGIIFQSQTAYKELRKLLVNQALVAVISLPAGCFNPYSGVKTSILILDKALAKQADSIAFFKIDNDGYDLGAQRRAVAGSDLPQVKKELDEYLHRLRLRLPTEPSPSGRGQGEGTWLTKGLVVAKEKLAANGEFNLSGERYREGAESMSAWPMVAVGDIFQKSGQTVLPETLTGITTYLGLENIAQGTGKLDGEITTENPAEIKSLKISFKPGDILYGKLRPNLNKVWLADRCGICSTDIFVIEALRGDVDPALYAFLFRTQRFNDAVMAQLKGAQLPRVGWTQFAELEIPLPPLEVQTEIVAEIEGYQKVIDGARAVLDHYRPHIPIHPDWPMVRLNTAASVQGGVQKSPSRQPTKNHRPYLTVRNVQRGYLNLTDVERFEVTNAELERLTLQFGDILVVEGNGSREQIGRTALFDIKGEEWVHQNHVIRVRLQPTKASPSFISVFLNSDHGRDQMLRNAVTTSGLYMLSVGRVEALEVPLPPLVTQQAIVAEIEAEQALVNGNRELIARFEQKIRTTLARVWGES